MHFMNNNNTSGNRPFWSLDTNAEMEGTAIANCFWIIKQIKNIKELKRENKDLNGQIEKLKFEIVKLKIENGKLDIDKANLEKKYEGASNTLKQALQKIKNLQNDPNKKGASNINLIQVSIDLVS